MSGATDARSTTELAERYSTAVRRFLAGEGEQALMDASDVGRQALRWGVGPLVLFSIHRDVVDRLTSDELPQGTSPSDTTAMFVEALAPFQMTYARLDEAAGAAHELAAVVEGQAHELRTARAALREDPGQAPERLDTVIERHCGELDRVGARLREAGAAAAARHQQVAEIVQAQEQERRRIAGEIHDDAVQSMTAVLLRLALLRRTLDGDEDRELIGELEASVSEAIARLRRVIVGLRPPDIEQRGLASTVRTALAKLKEDFAVDYQLTNGLTSEPSTDASAIAYRVLQEALANTRKHADATRVDVLLESRLDGVLVRVIDNGVGFEVTADFDRERPGHLGLATMRERAELCGGWLAIHSRPGRTTVEYWIPDMPRAGTEQ